jgi:hypothetical protein
MNRLTTAIAMPKWAALVLALSCGAAANPARATTYPILVNDVRLFIDVPAGWIALPPDPGYVYWASPNERKRITFHVRPAKQNETADSCSKLAIGRLRSLDRNISLGPAGRSLMRDISAGPRLAFADGTVGAGWLYRVVKPGDRKAADEICYWTIVARRGPLMCHLEVRWVPDAGHQADTNTSLTEQFCSEFQSICESLRSDSPKTPLPVAALVLYRQD